MRLLVTLVTLGAAALTVRAASPVAYVYPNPARVITVDGQAVTVDTAATVCAWTNGVMPSAAEQTRIRNLYRDWLDCEADFLVSFDRPVAAGTVTLYGEIDSSSALITIVGYNRVWVPVELGAMAAGQRIRLIRRMLGDDIRVLYGNSNLFAKPPKVSFLDVIQKFHCAATSHTTRNLDATVTVELCLFREGSDEPVASLGGFAYSWRDDQPGDTWFNAKVSRYEGKASDLDYFPEACRWEARGGSLGDVLLVNGKGEVEIASDSKSYPVLAPDRGPAPSDAIVEFDALMEMTPNPTVPTELLPDGARFSIGAVAQGGETNYWVLAKDGPTNAFRKADGPPVVPGYRHVRIESQSESNRTWACYSVDSVPVTVDGTMWLETAVKGHGTGKVSLHGEGTVKALYGRRRNGFRILYK